MESGELPEVCYPQANNSCRAPKQPPGQAMLIYVLLSSISIITVVLNLLVIFSITYFRQLHTPTNLLLLSLSVSDLLVGVLLMPVEIIYIEACWLLGDVACTLYYVIDYIITSASVANMVLISADRYMAICRPLSYLCYITNRTMHVGVSLCWLCSIAYRLLLLHDHLRKPGRSNSCLGECVVVISKVAGTVDLVFTFALPILVILVLYVQVLVVAFHHARGIRSQVGAIQAPRMVKKSELKAARTLAIVVAVFLLCFCPYYSPTITGKDTLVDATTVAFEIWLTHFNSCLNPIIYALFYPWFRKCIKLILTLQIFKPGCRDVSIFSNV
ncbi:trace amine-associated receptor 13c-like [Corythoichthys intestinalis]|uniref:trace amine-associated receptor 13c-like n=1 Tax=Corythoichthys intestinalis TaxID=161448 RepID=UPI0025A5BFF8|nr:trace amine-associated receptor 13c-like [Corythoichthys intestinalis]XP_061799781.1 trace amine-associated receptor 13c-like [Nerophis lumbriciformis]